MRVKYISLIHIVNKSSTFNISEFVIVLFYCIAFIIIIIIIIVINNNEPKAFVWSKGKIQKMYLLQSGYVLFVQLIQFLCLR